MFIQHSGKRITGSASLLQCIMVMSVFWTSCAFCAPVKVPMLLGELKNEQGAPLPLKKEWRKLFDLLERDTDLNFDVRIYPWSRALLNARNGEGLIFGLSKTTERCQFFHFSEPLFTNYVWLVTRSDASFNFSGVQDLSGKSVGVVRGVSYGDEFDQQKNHTFKLEEDNASLSSRLQKLARKRMDVLLFSDRETNPEEVAVIINKFIDEQMREALPTGVSFTVLRKPLQSVDIYIAVKAENDDGIIYKLNDSIVRQKKTGEIAKILKEN